VIRPFVSCDAPDIDFVWIWLEFQEELIGEERERVLRTLQTNTGAVVGAGRTHGSRFTGLTRIEVEEFFDAQSAELELLTMFELLATTEAILRIEFKERVSGRKKDGLSRRFRRIHKARGDKIRIDEDILAAMKAEGVATSVMSAFRGTLRLRHWLAHGRHWPPKLGRVYTPGDVFDISRALIDAIPPS
jgi:hypothetical protein